MFIKDIEKAKAEGKPIYKPLGITDVVDTSKGLDENGEPIMELTFTITDATKDRDRDIIEPKGWLFENFKKNPVKQWVHDYMIPPVGKSVKVWRNNKDQIKAAVVYQPDSNYQPNWTGITGSMVYRMYKTGFLNAVSVGFNPLEWEPIEKEEDEDDEMAVAPSRLLFGGVRFIKQDLLEFSAVPVPSNPNALVDRSSAREFKKHLKAWAKETIKQCDECSAAEHRKNQVTQENYESESEDDTMTAKIDEDAVMKPYENEHACRLRDPDDFQSDSFRRTSRKHEDKTYYVIMGRLTGETTMTEQAYRYKKDEWTAESARSHCKDHDGTFEAAKSMTTENLELKDQIVKTVRDYLGKRGRVLSDANEKKLSRGVSKINEGVQDINDVLAKVQEEEAAEPTNIKGEGEATGTTGVGGSETTAPTEPLSQSSDAPNLTNEGAEGGESDEIDQLGEPSPGEETNEELYEIDTDELVEGIDLAVQQIVDETLTDLGISLPSASTDSELEASDKPAAA